MKQIKIGTATLIHGDCEEFMKDLPDKSFDLIIVDPPYYETKGEFDFIWKSFDDYLSDVEIWANELKRISKDSASLFWWGNSKKIAYTQIILDKYFNLENSMIWEKKDSIQYQYYSADLARCFNTHNERVLYYSCEKGITGREFVEAEYIAPRNPFSLYLQSEFKRAGVTNKDIAKLFPSKTGGLTGCVSNWLNGNNVITLEQYQTIKDHLNGDYLRKEYDELRKEYDELRKEYDELRKEYDELRRPFNNTAKLTEVLSFSQQSSETRKNNHPTQKALKLTESLVNVTAKHKGKAYIPFVGSGTEVIACLNAGMEVYGSERDEDYFNAAVERVIKSQQQQKLF